MCTSFYLVHESRLIALERALSCLTETSLASPTMRRLATAVADLAPTSAAEDAEALRRNRLWRTLFAQPDRRPPTPSATADARARFTHRQVETRFVGDRVEATAGARR